VRGAPELDADPYATEVHRWWHYSRPSPELVAAVRDDWLGADGHALDLGCGLGTELAYLASVGFRTVGVDRSIVALQRAYRLHPNVRFVAADMLRLPFPDGCFEVALDRGSFHCLPGAERARYAAEVRRVLRPGGRFLLRACLYAAGIRNDLTPEIIRATFAGWRTVSLREALIPSDTRQMTAVVARYEHPGGA
jgi:SAM-dependent methyltransferase